MTRVIADKRTADDDEERVADLALGENHVAGLLRHEPAPRIECTTHETAATKEPQRDKAAPIRAHSKLGTRRARSAIHRACTRARSATGTLASKSGSKEIATRDQIIEESAHRNRAPSSDSRSSSKWCLGPTVFLMKTEKIGTALRGSRQHACGVSEPKTGTAGSRCSTHNARSARTGQRRTRAQVTTKRTQPKTRVKRSSAKCRRKRESSLERVGGALAHDVLEQTALQHLAKHTQKQAKRSREPSGQQRSGPTRKEETAQHVPVLSHRQRREKMGRQERRGVAGRRGSERRISA